MHINTRDWVCVNKPALYGFHSCQAACNSLFWWSISFVTSGSFVRSFFLVRLGTPRNNSAVLWLLYELACLVCKKKLYVRASNEWTSVGLLISLPSEDGNGPACKIIPMVIKFQMMLKQLDSGQSPSHSPPTLNKGLDWSIKRERVGPRAPGLAWLLVWWISNAFMTCLFNDLYILIARYRVTRHGGVEFVAWISL